MPGWPACVQRNELVDWEKAGRCGADKGARAEAASKSIPNLENFGGHRAVGAQGLRLNSLKCSGATLQRRRLWCGLRCFSNSLHLYCCSSILHRLELTKSVLHAQAHLRCPRAAHARMKNLHVGFASHRRHASKEGIGTRLCSVQRICLTRTHTVLSIRT